MWKHILLLSATLAAIVSSFAGIGLHSVMAQNTTPNTTSGNMSAGESITNVTTGGGGNMTAGGNMTNAPPGSGD
jgi:hypothetical protein